VGRGRVAPAGVHPGRTGATGRRGGGGRILVARRASAARLSARSADLPDRLPDRRGPPGRPRAGGRAVTRRDPLPPGPSAPAYWQLLRYTHSPLPYLEGCARRHGDEFTVRLAGYGTLVVLADPEAVRDVFRGDGDALHSGEGNEFLAAS